MHASRAQLLATARLDTTSTHPHAMAQQIQMRMSFALSALARSRVERSDVLKHAFGPVSSLCFQGTLVFDARHLDNVLPASSTTDLHVQGTPKMTAVARSVCTVIFCISKFVGGCSLLADGLLLCVHNTNMCLGSRVLHPVSLANITKVLQTLAMEPHATTTVAHTALVEVNARPGLFGMRPRALVPMPQQMPALIAHRFGSSHFEVAIAPKSVRD